MEATSRVPGRASSWGVRSGRFQDSAWSFPICDGLSLRLALRPSRKREGGEVWEVGVLGHGVWLLNGPVAILLNCPVRNA